MLLNANELPKLINQMGKRYKRKTLDYIWIATTNDDYEFPLIIKSNSKDLATALNTSQSNVCHGATRQQTVKGYKIFKIEDTEE